MEFGIEKYEILVMTKNEVNVKYLGILEVDAIKNMKERKEYSTRTISDMKLCSRNLIKEVNSTIAAIVRDRRVSFNWIKEYLSNV